MNGIINLLKPPGMSSNGAVGFFKRLLNTKKIGHAGTLDPGACGVLVLMVGKATKLSDYMMNKDKEYVFEITFGAQTDTQDAYGQVVNRSNKEIAKDELCDVLPYFTGDIMQTPPAYSAINVNGKRAYQLARKGETVELKPRQVTVSALEMLNQTGDNRFLLKAVCSKGTYIRTLAEDIGKKLAVSAYTSFLERTRSGRFLVAEAVTLDEAEEAVKSGELSDFLLPMDMVLSDLPKAIVNVADFKRITNGLDGQLVHADENAKNMQYRVYCCENLIGLGIIKEKRVKITTFLLSEKMT